MNCPYDAFLFPGQGSQSVGMVRLFPSYPEAMGLFERARAMLGFDVFGLCLHGPEEELSADFHAQLAVHATNCAYAAVLARMGLRPRLASGFSLGIFSALVAAGSLSFEQGLAGVKLAAEEMAREGREQKGAMGAVIGLAEEEVEEICRGVPGVYLASVNTARQVVVSGEESAMEGALRVARERGALMVKRLPIGWAIHTPLMDRASRGFAEAIAGWKIRPPDFPVLSYLRAEYLRTPEEIREELSAQFSSRNRWHAVLRRMIREGVRLFIEVGPGSVLSQMVRWVDREAQTKTAEEILKENPKSQSRPGGTKS